MSDSTRERGEGSMSQSLAISPHEIIVFDFDGTITTRDTFALFLRYYAGTTSWALNILKLLPIFTAYGLRIVDRNAVKAHVIRRFFKNAPIRQLNESAKTFARDVIPGLIRPLAQAELNRKKTAPESLYICSASILPYLAVWGKDQNICHILATELEDDGSVYTGEIKGWNVWGDGKIKRIYHELGTNSVRILEAYGDSRGDQELLLAAEVPHWRPFRLNETHD